MTWTFDPLVARNAYFNIEKLGARPTHYMIDYYGQMSDGINAGQASDRVLLTWDLTVDTPPPPGRRLAGPDLRGPLGGSERKAGAARRADGLRAPHHRNPR